jgi:hypothetical protein
LLKKAGDLVGLEVRAVAFVRDVVEFGFDGLTLRCDADPYVAIGEVAYRFPKPGSRDALCLIIGSTVLSVELVDGEHFAFTTSNGCRVSIPLAKGEAPRLA